jgi:small-conductance mechanosensitive channel
MELEFGAAWERLQKILNGVVASLPNIAIGLIVFALFLVAARLTWRATVRYTESRTGTSAAALAVGRLAYGVVIVVGLLVAAAVALPTFRPGDLIQVLGIGSVAIGFAFRDILQNFLAGILLLLTRPFQIGDQIVSGQLEGTVEEVQTRATFLKTYDGRRVVIPNAELFTNKVVVNTAFDKRRVEYDVGVGYGDDLDVARDLILAALGGCKGVLQDPPPEALVMELAPSAVNIRARWWISPPRIRDALDSRDEVLAAIKKKLTESGIDLPYPTHQVLFHDQTEEIDGDRRHQREGWPAGPGDPPKPRRPAAAETVSGNHGGTERS